MSFWKRMFGMARKTEASNPGAYSPERWVSTLPSAKIRVDEEVGLTYSAVFACIRIISETLASLPWHVFERVGENREARPEHPVDTILHVRPNPEMTACVFRETLGAHVLGWGNAYAEIERNRVGEVVALWPLEPNRVEPKRDDNGQIYYEVRGGKSGRIDRLPPEKIYHLRGIGYDGLKGYSPIRLARESIAMGLAMERFGGAFFGNGTRLSGVLSVDGTLNDETRTAIMDAWKKAFSGSTNAHKTPVLEGGTKFQQISVAPEEAQFLESRKFQVTEIARWYRVPPHKLAELDRSTNNNIEHQALEFVQDTIVPWVTRCEQEANIKLFGSQERGFFTRMNLNALLRGDVKSRGEFYTKLFQMGWSPNEIRALEDLNPIGPDGDIRLVPMNMITLENAKNNQPRSASQPRDNQDI